MAQGAQPDDEGVEDPVSLPGEEEGASGPGEETVLPQIETGEGLPPLGQEVPRPGVFYGSLGLAVW